MSVTVIAELFRITPGSIVYVTPGRTSRSPLYTMSIRASVWSAVIGATAEDWYAMLTPLSPLLVTVFPEDTSVVIGSSLNGCAIAVRDR